MSGADVLARVVAARANPPRDHARQAYDALADVYDVFTAHHDYDAWTATIERLVIAHGLAGRELLDLACGTGKSFLPFARRGYAVTAADVSPGMLARAREKAPVEVALHEADLRAVPVLGAFDLVTCLDDAINSLTTPNELTAAFKGFKSNLAPDGLAIFDANTLFAYRTAFAQLNVVPRDDRVVVTRGAGAADLPPAGLATATFDIYARTSLGWRSERSIHHQRHHPGAVVRGALDAAGLELVAVHGMRFDGSLTDTVDELVNSKALYIVRCAAPEGERG